MTIRKGNHGVYHGVHQFIRESNFDYFDLIEASNVEEQDVVDDINIARRENDEPEIDDIGEADEWEVKDYIGAFGLATDDTVLIQRILEADHREWVHLYDGTVHDVVELYPEEDE